MKQHTIKQGIKNLYKILPVSFFYVSEKYKQSIFPADAKVNFIIESAHNSLHLPQRLKPDSFFDISKISFTISGEQYTIIGIKITKPDLV